MEYYFRLFKKKVRNYLYDHPLQYGILDNGFRIIITMLSALIFSFGFKCFIQPNYQGFTNPDLVFESGALLSLASNGISGITQSVLVIFKLLHLDFILDPFNQYVLTFIAYFIINIPLLIVGFIKVGKKFAFYSLLNVIFVTILGIILPNGENDLITLISEYIFLQPIARIIFAGICTGIATALSYLIESTCGGIDIIAFYISEKKSTGVGIYSAMFNCCIVILFTILSTISGGYVDNIHFYPVSMPSAIVIFLYTFIYMIITTLVVDFIHTSNKKLNIQIITKDINVAQVIMANIPHGCTILKGWGAYTMKDTYVILVTVRKSERKRVVKICKMADPNCFINVLVTEQVFGKFFKKPIR